MKISDYNNLKEFPLDQYLQLNGSTGFCLSKLPSSIFNDIKPLIDEIQNNFSTAEERNKSLVGEINHEYALTLPNSVVNFIREKTEIVGRDNPILYDIGRYLSYADTGQFPGEAQPSDQQSHLPTLKYDGDAWVNFQQKHEYNPPHSHSGVFSFVIWYQIPYYIKDELPYNSGQKRKISDYSTNGEFSFLYTIDSKMFNQPLFVDKTKEGYMAIFPSSLSHYVNPFYSSDDYRITISGNINLSPQM